MLEVKVIASGSSGNCTLVKSSAGENIILDAGIPYKTISAAAEYKPIDYALITHEHADHANKATIKSLLERGTEIFMTEGTKRKLNLEERHNLHTLKVSELTNTSWLIGNCYFFARLVQHDAADPVIFKVTDGKDTILYLTDAGKIPENFTTPFTKILIETNYSEAALAESSVDEYQKKRLAKYHLSYEKVQAYFKFLKYETLLESLKEVHLMHISQRHGDGAEFKEMLSEVLGEIPIYTH